MIVRDENSATDALAIVERYEAFVTYLYPILQTSPRKHGVFRDVVLAQLFSPIGGLYHAAKSRQVSRLHAVDAEFATLRSHMRFMVRSTVRIITPHPDISGDLLHATCCGPERESYVNLETGEPLKDGEPIPKPFKFRARDFR